MAAVSYRDPVPAKLREWAEVARRIGWGARFAAAMREMDERLRRDPESWDDPVQDLRHARLTVYYRYGPLLIVQYAVHVGGTPVFVTDVNLTPETLLDYACR
jgi:hypothetical protein